MQVRFTNVVFEEDLLDSISKMFYDRKMLFEQEMLQVLQLNLTEVIAVKLNSFHNMSNTAVASFVVVMNTTQFSLNETKQRLSDVVSNGEYKSMTIDQGFDFQLEGMDIPYFLYFLHN